MSVQVFWLNNRRIFSYSKKRHSKYKMQFLAFSMRDEGWMKFIVAGPYNYSCSSQYDVMERNFVDSIWDERYDHEEFRPVIYPAGFMDSPYIHDMRDLYLDHRRIICGLGRSCDGRVTSWCSNNLTTEEEYKYRICDLLGLKNQESSQSNYTFGQKLKTVWNMFKTY